MIFDHWHHINVLYSHKWTPCGCKKSTMTSYLSQLIVYSLFLYLSTLINILYCSAPKQTRQKTTIMLSVRGEAIWGASTEKEREEKTESHNNKTLKYTPIRPTGVLLGKKKSEHWVGCYFDTNHTPKYCCRGTHTLTAMVRSNSKGLRQQIIVRNSLGNIFSPVSQHFVKYPQKSNLSFGVNKQVVTFLCQ